MSPPESGFLVRTARLDDFPAVAALTVAVYIGEGYSAAVVEPSLRDVAARAEETRPFVASDAVTHKVLGAVSCITSESRFAQIANPDEGEFRLLAVEPNARGVGVGDALVRACIEYARSRGCVRLVLSTQPSMLAAQRLYARLGFQRVPERDWRTDSGGERLVYVMTLRDLGKPRIRQAVVEEAPAITALVEAAYAPYIERIGRPPAPMLADYGASVEQGEVYVLSGDSGLRAVLVLRPDDQGMFVENIAVHPAFQGQGFGHQLMGFAEAIARDLRLSTVHLYTNEAMEGNLRFYTGLGYQEIGRRTESGFRRVFFRKSSDVAGS